MSPRTTDPDCVAFLQWALPRMRLRWPGFRKVRRQVCKRLGRRLRTLGLRDLAEYRAYLEEHAGEWGHLDGLCRITISRFYRDRAVFDLLRESALPALGEAALVRGDGLIRCWSVGCASGEEPYSLALAWTFETSKRVPGAEVHITATEADPHLLERARRARYPAGALKELPAEWIPRAFDAVGEELCLRQPFRGMVEWVRQDIRQGMPEGPFDLVLCRNLVFTYFDGQLQEALLARMLECLRPGGLLVVGGHEALPPGSWALDRPFGRRPVYRLLDP